MYNLFINTSEIVSIYLFLSGRWFINIIKRLNLKLEQWNITALYKDQAKDVYDQLKLDLESVNIHIQFEFAGNACRKLFDQKNHADVVNLVHRDEATKVLLWKFSNRKIASCFIDTF